MSKKSVRRLSSLRYTMKDSEEWRICLLGEWGFHAKTIARRVFGSKNPGTTETSRIYRALKRGEIRLRDWRNGETAQARSVLSRGGRATDKKKLKLRVA